MYSWEIAIIATTKQQRYAECAKILSVKTTLKNAKIAK